jgi:gas vesicle protein
VGQDTEELKREIEYTRNDMSGTLEAIGDRVSPGRIVQRKKNRVSQTVGSMRDRVMGTAQDAKEQLSQTSGNATEAVKHAPEMVAQRASGAPMVAGGIAFGLGFLVAVAFPPSQAEENASAKVRDAIEPIKEDIVESAQQVMDHVKEPAKEHMESLKETSTEAARSVASTAKDASSSVKDEAMSSVETIKSSE